MFSTLYVCLFLTVYFLFHFIFRNKSLHKYTGLMMLNFVKFAKIAEMVSDYGTTGRQHFSVYLWNRARSPSLAPACQTGSWQSPYFRSRVPSAGWTRSASLPGRSQPWATANHGTARCSWPIGTRYRWSCGNWAERWVRMCSCDESGTVRGTSDWWDDR